MTKKQKKVLWRIIATAVLVAVVKIFSIGGVAGTVLYLAAYLIIGYDILRKAFRGIIKGQVFDENFLMAVATWVPLHWPSTRKAATIWRPWP